MARTPIFGIGNTISGATLGSVLFGGTGGILAQDNTNFFYDTATAGTEKLSLGNPATKDARLNVKIITGGNLIRLQGTSGSGLLLYKGAADNSLYIRQGSTDTLTFGSTDGRLGILSTTPTHTLTLGSTSTGFVLYNTSDQTTNYERALMYFTSNELQIVSEKGGSGSQRNIRITQLTSGGELAVNVSALPYVVAKAPTVNSTSSVIMGLAVMHSSATLNASSGVQWFSGITPTYNQTSTAGAIDLYINRTETAIGSGQHDFLNMAIAGSSKARIDRTGHIFVDSTVTAGGTTGNQTINKPSGTVNFAAAATAITVTNSTVSTSSIVLAVVRTADATARIAHVVPGAGSFIITLTAAATAETSVGFVVIN